MLENIIQLVKDQVLPVINNNADIPENKKNDAIETTTNSILEGIKKQLMPDGISDISNMFSNSESSPINNFGNTEMIKGVESTVSSALSDKIGLNAQISTAIASAIVPIVINMLKQGASKDGESSFDISSLIGMLTGNNNQNKEKDGGILGKLGGLFGG